MHFIGHNTQRILSQGETYVHVLYYIVNNSSERDFSQRHEKYVNSSDITLKDFKVKVRVIFCVILSERDFSHKHERQRGEKHENFIRYYAQRF